jgi:SAM-dependent methyltransferase
MNFDSVADVYWLLEKLTFQGVLQRARTFGIDKIPGPARALIVGEGNGRFIEQLLRAHSAVEVDCLDASGRMLDLARRRLHRDYPTGLNRVRFQQSDILTVGLTNRYDLIVTHFVLDCFEGDELKRLVAKLAGEASPNCVWLLADFTVPQGGWRKVHAVLWIAMMYAFFRLTTNIRASKLTDPAGLLQRAGFALRQEKRWRAGMVKSQVWERKLNDEWQR